MKMLKRFFKEEDGVVNIEYGLIAAIIAVALIVTLGLVTGALQGIYNRVVVALNAA